MDDKKEKKYIIDNPTLMDEWNYEKNNELVLDPKTLTCGSGKKAWWKCNKGHEWQANIDSRSKGSGCPYCAGKKVIAGVNDLATTNPKLASEWNYERNNELRPIDVMPNTNLKVWWKCDNGHEWQAIIASRTKGRGCPICSNKKVLKGYNDLATLNSKLANEWNYEKNGDLKPENFTCGNDKKVWWKCNKGHEWRASIVNRTKGRGCPICSNKQILIGYNDLATINPKLASEWNYKKNSNLRPEDFTANSNKKVWWKCSKCHEWLATINSRNSGNNCPYCSNQKVLEGYNDLATRNSKLANEWNYEKNGDLKPEDFTVGSEKKVWWKCNKGHEWLATIFNRNKANGTNCPQCYKNKSNKTK